MKKVKLVAIILCPTIITLASLLAIMLWRKIKHRETLPNASKYAWSLLQ